VSRACFSWRIAVLASLVACLGALIVAPSLAAPPRGAVLYSVTFSAEATRMSAWENSGGPPNETCPRATIFLAKKLTLASRFYVAETRDSAKQFGAGNRSFRNPWESTGRVPTTGQVSIAVKLGPTAQGCAAGENLPPESCNLNVRVRSMQVHMSVFSWYLQVPNNLRQDSPCTQMATAFDSEIFTVGALKDKLLRPLLLRGKSFTYRGTDSAQWGEGTARLSWSARFTPIKKG